MTELDRQLADYKRKADRRELADFSRADALWLLNELIYERDAAERPPPQDAPIKVYIGFNAWGQLIGAWTTAEECAEHTTYFAEVEVKEALSSRTVLPNV